jgi:hypothetical protein
MALLPFQCCCVHALLIAVLDLAAFARGRRPCSHVNLRSSQESETWTKLANSMRDSLFFCHTTNNAVLKALGVKSGSIAMVRALTPFSLAASPFVFLPFNLRLVSSAHVCVCVEKCA